MITKLTFQLMISVLLSTTLAQMDCSNHLLGCSTCINRTTYMECTKCINGLFHVKHNIHMTRLSCVMDCGVEHPSYVNDVSTMECLYCGKGCVKCHPVVGCLRCAEGSPQGSGVFKVCDGSKDVNDGIVQNRFKKCKDDKCQKCLVDSYVCLKCEYGYYWDDFKCVSPLNEVKSVEFIVGDINLGKGRQFGDVVFPYQDLMIVLHTIYDICSKYTRCQATVYLMKQTHYVFKSNEQVYPDSVMDLFPVLNVFNLTVKPLVCGTIFQNQTIDHNCVDSRESVVVVNKIAGLFMIRVGNQFTLENIVIDSIDSQLVPNDPCLTQPKICCKLMNNQITPLVPLSKCISTTTTRASLSGQPVMFPFQYQNNSQIMRMTNVVVKNIFYDLETLIQYRKNRVQIEITNCIFTQLGYLGSIINNLQNVHRYIKIKQVNILDLQNAQYGLWMNQKNDTNTSSVHFTNCSFSHFPLLLGREVSSMDFIPTQVVGLISYTRNHPGFKFMNCSFTNINIPISNCSYFKYHKYKIPDMSQYKSVLQNLFTLFYMEYGWNYMILNQCKFINITGFNWNLVFHKSVYISDSIFSRIVMSAGGVLLGQGMRSQLMVQRTSFDQITQCPKQTGTDPFPLIYGTIVPPTTSTSGAQFINSTFTNLYYHSMMFKISSNDTVKNIVNFRGCVFDSNVGSVFKLMLQRYSQGIMALNVDDWDVFNVSRTSMIDAEVYSGEIKDCVVRNQLDMSVNSQQRQMHILNVHSQVGLHKRKLVLSNITIENIHGVTIGSITQFTDLTPTINGSLISIGNTSFQIGIQGPLIYLTKADFPYIELTQLTFQNIHYLSNIRNNLLVEFESGFQVDLIFLSTILITNLVPHQIRGWNINTTDLQTTLIDLSELNKQQVIMVSNIHIKSIGKSSTPLPLLPIIISQGTILDNLACENIHSTTYGCVHIIMQSEAITNEVSISNSKFTNINSAISTIHLGMTTYSINLSILDCIFMNNTNTNHSSSDITLIRQVNQDKELITIRNCIFTGAYNDKLTINYTITNPLVSLSMSNNLFDCYHPQYNQPYAEKVVMGEQTLPNKSVISVQDIIGVLQNISIRNCYGLNLAPVYYFTKNQQLSELFVEFDDVSIVNCFGKVSGGIYVNNKVKISGMNAVNLVGVNSTLVYYVGHLELVNSVVKYCYGLEYGVSGVDGVVVNVRNITFEDNISHMRNSTMQLMKLTNLQNSSTNSIINCTFIHTHNYPTRVYITRSNIIFKQVRFAMNIASIYFNIQNSEIQLISSSYILQHPSQLDLNIFHTYQTQLSLLNNEFKSINANSLIDHQGSKDISIINTTFTAVSVISSLIQASSFNHMLINSTSILNLQGRFLNVFDSKLCTISHTYVQTDLEGMLIKQSDIKVNNLTLISTNGRHGVGGVQLEDMDMVDIDGLTVIGFRGVRGGGIGIKDSKLTNVKKQLSNVVVEGNTASELGGGMYLDNIHIFTFIKMTIRGNKVSGDGGGVYYNTSRIEIERSMIITSMVVSGNHATQSGGGIAWTYYQLMITQVTNNTADFYGPNYASFPTTIKFIQSKRKLAQINGTSGQLLPEFKIGLMDHNGQIYKPDSTSFATLQSSNQTINGIFSLLNGQQQVNAHQGVFVFNKAILISFPGHNQNLFISTNGLDEGNPSKQMNQTKLVIQIKIRKCNINESFTHQGKCEFCQPPDYYQTLALSQPGACHKCDPIKMICKGGNQYGPSKGYWRQSNHTPTIYECPRQDSCLGYITSKMGDCETGYKGNLCVECEQGYSINDDFVCGKCPSNAQNIIQLFISLIISLGILVVIVWITIQGANKKKSMVSILIKILTNHFQIILLIYQFNLNWPEEVRVLIKVQRPVVSSVTQFMSLECFVQDMNKSTQPHQLLFIQLLIYTIFPYLVIIVSSVFWCIKSTQLCKGVRKLRQSRIITTVIIALYVLHPFIIKTMFDSLNCSNIEGVSYLVKRPSIRCFTNPHLLYVLFITAPTLIIWGLGTPMIMILVLYRNRHHLTTEMVKQKYGFLYNGYKTKRQGSVYYWEGLMVLKKMIIIIIQVKLYWVNIKIQAYSLLLLQFIFYGLTSTLRPFQIHILNRIEIFSHYTALITVFAGIFYITIDDFSIIGLMLLFASILVFNLIFFITWLYTFFKEVWKSLITKLPRLYRMLTFWSSKEKRLNHIENIQIHDESMGLRSELEEMLQTLLRAVDSKKLVLNQRLLGKLKVHLDVDEIIKLGEEQVECDRVEYEARDVEDKYPDVGIDGEDVGCEVNQTLNQSSQRIFKQQQDQVDSKQLEQPSIPVTPGGNSRHGQVDKKLPKLQEKQQINLDWLKAIQRNDQ